MADTESLPSGIDLESYREELRKEATRLVTLPWPTIPWYVRQQALLFLAAFDPAKAPVVRTGTGPETRYYRELIRFLHGEGDRLRSSDFATLAVLARRAFVDRERAVELTRPGLNFSRKRELGQRAPSFLLELIDTETDVLLFDDLSARIREDLCRTSESSDDDHNTLAKVVLSTHPNGSLRNELSAEEKFRLVRPSQTAARIEQVLGKPGNGRKFIVRLTVATAEAVGASLSSAQRGYLEAMAE